MPRTTASALVRRPCSWRYYPVRNSLADGAGPRGRSARELAHSMTPPRWLSTVRSSAPQRTSAAPERAGDGCSVRRDVTSGTCWARRGNRPCTLPVIPSRSGVSASEPCCPPPCWHRRCVQRRPRAVRRLCGTCGASVEPPVQRRGRAAARRRRSRFRLARGGRGSAAITSAMVGLLESLRGPGLHPYATGVAGVYLCSAATPPGAGLHGMCGHLAARAALTDQGLVSGS